MFADTSLLSHFLFRLPSRMLEPAQDLQQQTTQATMAVRVQGTNLDPCGWPPLLCLHSGLDFPAMHLHTISLTFVTGPTAMCIPVVRSYSHESTCCQPILPELAVCMQAWIWSFLMSLAYIIELPEASPLHVIGLIPIISLHCLVHTCGDILQPQHFTVTARVPQAACGHRVDPVSSTGLYHCLTCS